jgi:crotonobetainyl-CoA:carnitine CoA-transferase CaiB-like acyl-CoA transferase
VVLRGHIPIAPVRSIEEALDSTELTERGMLAAYPHPSLGEVRSVGLPIALSDFEPTYRPGPGLGADGDAILADLGYAEEEIAALRTAGAFGAGGAAEDEPRDEGGSAG